MILALFCTYISYLVTQTQAGDPRKLNGDYLGPLDQARSWDEAFGTISNLGSLKMNDWDQGNVASGSGQLLNYAQFTDVNQPYLQYGKGYEYSGQDSHFGGNTDQCAHSQPEQPMGTWQRSNNMQGYGQASQPSYVQWQPYMAEDDGSSAWEDTYQGQHSSEPKVGMNDGEINLSYMEPKKEREYSSPFWRDLESTKMKRTMSKRYKQLTGTSLKDETRRHRLRTRCDASIQADLLANDLASGLRAVRNLDFQSNLEKVFTSTERARLKQVMEDEFGIHPQGSSTALSWGIDAMSDEAKEFFGYHGIVGNPDQVAARYSRLANNFKKEYERRRTIESRKSWQKEVQNRG